MYFLGIDVGTGGTRALLIDEQGRAIASATEEHRAFACDVRTEEQTQHLTTQIGTDRLIQLTCNPALINFTLTKCLWVRENEPNNCVHLSG